MQLKKINAAIAHYKSLLSNNRHNRELFPWETQQIFQTHWDIEAPDFGKMYDRCLENTQTRRWWTGVNFEPKKRMLEFINLNSDFVRNMFRELFNEDKPVANRISKFQFGCDIMLDDYKKANPTTIENNHFHHDNHIISMYLAFRYPDKYAVFYYADFMAAMRAVGTTNLPDAYDLERFFKISKTLFTFLKKDEALMEMHHQQIKTPQYYPEDSLLLVTDFYKVIAAAKE